MATDEGRPQLCVGAIVIDCGRLLVIQRGRGAAVGKWSIPGGRVDWGETLEQAVVRELLEETGLRGSSDRLVGWVERISAEHHFVIADFVVRVDPPEFGELCAADDADAATWHDLHRLVELDLVDGLFDFLVEHGFVPTPH